MTKPRKSPSLLGPEVPPLAAYRGPVEGMLRSNDSEILRELLGVIEATRDKNIKLKYKILPGMMLCIGLMLATGAFGAISDPGANMRMANSKLIHFSLAITTLLANLLVTWKEWQEIARNGVLVEAVMDRVRQIRKEKGLDKPANPQPTKA